MGESVEATSGARGAAGVVALLGVLALVHVLPVFSQIDNWGIEDWDLFFFYHAAGRESVVESAQWPLWNPWSCGGAPLLGNPQSRVLAPTFPLVLWLGEVRGLKVEIWLNLWLGMWGAYVLAREEGLRGAGAALVPVVYLLSSMYALILATGAANFLSIAWLPWAMWAFVRAERDLRWAAAAGLLLAVTFFAGGHYVVLMAAMLMGLRAVVDAAALRSARPVAALALSGAIALGLGAIKVLPAAELMAAHPRHAADAESGYSAAGLWEMLTSRDQRLERGPALERSAGPWRGYSAEMMENGAYVGVGVLALAAAGVALRGRRQWRWVAVLLVFGWISLGSRVPVSLWDGLRRLPVFEQMQAAMRFRICWLLGAAVLAGAGLEALTSAVRRRVRGAWPARAAGAVAVVLIAGDLVLVSRPILAGAFPIEPEVVLRALPERGVFAQIVRLPAYGAKGPRGDLDWFDTADVADVPVDVSYSAMYPALLRNLGTVWAYEPVPVAKRAVPQGAPGYRGEVYLSGMSGTARYEEWTPNRLRVAVEAGRADEVVINQNYAAGWRASGAASAARANAEGLLSAAVEAGTWEVTFVYRPRSFVAGAGISAGTAVVCVGALWISARRRAARGANLAAASR